MERLSSVTPGDPLTERYQALIVTGAGILFLNTDLWKKYLVLFISIYILYNSHPIEFSAFLYISQYFLPNVSISVWAIKVQCHAELSNVL